MGSNRGSWTARRAAWLSSAALLGSLLALGVLALSPANALRQASLPHAPGFVTLVRMSLSNAYLFLRISLSKDLLPLLVAGLAFSGLSYLIARRQARPMPGLPRLALAALACLAAGYGLIVCAVAPSAYAESSYPDLRALIAPWWVLILIIAAWGWLAGQALTLLIKEKAAPAAEGLPAAAGDPAGAGGPAWAGAIAAVILLAACALPIRTAAQTYAQLPRFQRWAAFWDARDAAIRQASQSNQGRVEVMEIDHIITDVSELNGNPTFWYNVCAARYYGVHQIVADLPGWDK